MSLMLPSPLNRVVIPQFAQHHSSTVMAVVKVVLTIFIPLGYAAIILKLNPPNCWKKI